LSFFFQNDRFTKKLNHICELILGGHRNSELYDKEEFDSRSKGVTAMKFFKGQDNARIYCKEITNAQGVFIVIAAEVHVKKKSQKLQHKEKAIIHRVAQYEYKKIKEPRSH